jgi:hypothetical protein
MQHFRTFYSHVYISEAKNWFLMHPTLAYIIFVHLHQLFLAFYQRKYIIVKYYFRYRSLHMRKLLTLSLINKIINLKFVV